jgi:hypothetical protein
MISIVQVVCSGCDCEFAILYDGIEAELFDEVSGEELLCDRCSVDDRPLLTLEQRQETVRQAILNGGAARLAKIAHEAGWSSMKLRAQIRDQGRCLTPKERALFRKQVHAASRRRQLQTDQ